MPQLTTLLLIALLLWPAGAAVETQPPADPQPAAAGGEARGQAVPIDELPPPVRLGARAETIRRAWPVIPEVVIVFDEASYLEAIAHWTATARFPVLIDDGTPESREDIARFIRAYQPRRIVRWSAGDEPAVLWSGDRAQRRSAVESVLFRLWSKPLPGEGLVAPISSIEALIDRWRQIGVVPSGVVVCDVNDPAWPAAVALAAGRLQPLLWITPPEGSSFGGRFDRAQFEQFAGSLEEAVDALELSWRTIGDDIDSISVCLNIPVRVQADRQNVLAMTDMLGRHIDQGHDQAEGRYGDRWAWASQIAGDQSRSAYMAMCSLFLVPETAWLFDGYSGEEPWVLFDARQAAEHLERAGLRITLDGRNRQDVRQWRSRIAKGVDAGLITVNTRGMANEFHLPGGRLRPGDVPQLNIPAIVYFVHSFSASSLGSRATVGARFLERGAYAYCGSVHEPTLMGFIPTPIFAARFTMAYPWAAALRMDDGPPWKIAAIGDPLLALGPPAPRAGEDIQLPLAGAVDLNTLMQRALDDQRYADAIMKLALMGRDDHAARLAAAVLAEDPSLITPEVAQSALMSVFRRGELNTFVALYQRLDPEQASGGWQRDALWRKAHDNLLTARSDELLELLAAHLRPDQIGRDAATLAGPMAQRLGAAAAMRMLDEAHERTTSSREQSEIENARERIRRRIGRPQR